MKRNGQRSKGKSFDAFTPIAPLLVTADELPDPQNIPLELRVNGLLMQSGSTADQIFRVAEVITGTSDGLGLDIKPPRFLKRGDVMELVAGPVGTHRQRVV